ncbi:Crp/Fnr family transcriptional regulator [Microvirga sp. GCM10011540]|uniref:Crp/Fnr family transcriptional regulator n=1 Tax=Microvirga sp. GCM10011540 TaxID=3317338 RepID=UPI0036215EB0
MAQVPGATRHQANRILAALEPADFAYLEPHLEIVDLPRGKVIYDVGETIQHTFFPHDAMVSLVTLMEDGTSAEMAVFGREGLFGLVSAVVSRQAFGRYVGQVPGTASRINRDRMQEAMASRPGIQQLVLRFTEALMAQILQSVACNAAHTVEARCCRWILSTHDRVDQDDLPLTHEFLSEMLGVQRSTVSTIVHTLQEAGLISQRRGLISIASRAGLEERTCECYAIIRRKYAQVLPLTYQR